MHALKYTSSIFREIILQWSSIDVILSVRSRKLSGSEFESIGRNSKSRCPHRSKLLGRYRWTINFRTGRSQVPTTRLVGPGTVECGAMPSAETAINELG